ncbi:hypothetical protein E4T56_gene20670, partial [Termitomyces sp. T112]
MSKYSTKWLKVSVPVPHVLHVELSRSPVNAFSSEYWREYGRLFETLIGAHAAGEDIRALVVSSAISKMFTAGLDLHSATDLASAASDTKHDRARAS